jgi:hypothetical protein
MVRLRFRRQRSLVVASALVAFALGASAVGLANAGRSSQKSANGAITANVTPATAQTASSGGGTMAAGHRVRATTSNKQFVPTARQLLDMQAELLETADVPAPNRNTTNSSQNPGPPVPAPGPRAADTDYKQITTHKIPTGQIVGGSSYSSFVNEPSVSNNGKHWFVTGNWYAGYSHDKGNTWTFLNPFSLFGSGFCCDQVTVYDKTHNRVYWLLQYGGHLTVANSLGSDLVNWCYYEFTNTNIGQASTTSLDFNDAMIGTRNFYFTTNIFPTSGYGSEIVRLPLEQMTSCGGFGFNYYSQLDSFTWRLAQGSNDRAYWGSDWDPTGARPNGTSFRVFYWDENSGTVAWNNYTINGFAFYTRNTGQNCASDDNVVKNWCQFADSRTLGAYRANGVIGFSMNAKQGGFAAFPYTVREYFRESDLAYLGNTNLYATTFAIQFLALGPNSRGHVGGAYSWGGGTAGTHYYPGSAALVDDDVTPSQPWTNDFYQFGTDNTCTYGGLYRWGDYLTARANDPADTTWLGTGFKFIGDCSTGYAQPIVIAFGRTRDIGDWKRWK